MSELSVRATALPGVMLSQQPIASYSLLQRGRS